MAHAHRLAAFAVVVAACGGPEKPPDRPCPDVPPDAAMAAPPMVDASASALDAAPTADAIDAGTSDAAVDAGRVAESLDMLRARVAALEIKTTSIAADPIPKNRKSDAEQPSSGHPGRMDGHRTQIPLLYRAKPLRMSDGLPPEVISRIVRQNFGRMRLCFEQGYARNPTLTRMSVTTRFAIAQSGETVLADPTATNTDTGTTLCIVRAFQGLSYPQPEVPLVAVEYTISVVFPE